MKQLLVYNVDLMQTEEEGEFLCPCCRTIISPDDETDIIYSILDVKVRNAKLENLLINCNICSNKILLTGFSAE
ncbi:MAG: hypothetical protein P8X91_05650 [Candidatus Bathyarchaeota archaeon]|jgi:hypothetical protein